MKEHYGQFAIAGAIVIGAIIFAFAIHGLTHSIEVVQRKPASSDLGRFQMALTRGFKDGVIALRIDTTTGTTAIFNTEFMSLMTDSYRNKLKAEGLTLTAEMEQNAEKSGLYYTIPTHWENLPEQAEGWEVRGPPSK